MKKIFSDKRAIVIFLLPAALVYAIFAIYPVIMSGYYSLLDWNGVGDAKFIGLSNYVKLFVGNNDGFGSALLNSFILAFLSVFVQLTLLNRSPLAVSCCLNKSKTCLSRTFSQGDDGNVGSWSHRDILNPSSDRQSGGMRTSRAASPHTWDQKGYKPVEGNECGS